MADKKRVLSIDEQKKINDLFWNQGKTFTQISKEMRRSTTILYRTIFTTREEFSKWGEKIINSGMQ